MGYGVLGLNRSFWKDRRVLVTGHTGFKGAWLCLLLEELGAQVSGLALEPPDGGAYCSFLPWTNVESHYADLRDAEAVTSIVQASDPEVIIHMGAQALEPVGFDEPVMTYATNVMGTVHLLEACSAAPSLQSIVIVTSDKVYENKELGRSFKEDDPLGGKGPYSGSKACVEYVVKSYRQDPTKDFASRLATGRAGNVIGGGDHSRARLLPDVFRALAQGKEVELRNPKAVRPWQFVLNPLLGYLVLAERLFEDPGLEARAYNFGPPVDESISVGELVDRTLAVWGEGSWVDTGETFPEAVQLRLDPSMAQRTLGWYPVIDIDTALRWTADWYRSDPEGPERRLTAVRQIRSFMEMLQQ